MELEKELTKISTIHQITQDYAGCYLSNFEDDYICHKHNGGCRNIDKCRVIFEKEKNKEE